MISANSIDAGGRLRDQGREGRLPIAEKWAENARAERTESRKEGRSTMEEEKQRGDSELWICKNKMKTTNNRSSVANEF